MTKNKLPSLVCMVELLEGGYSFQDIADEYGAPKREVLDIFDAGSSADREKPFLERASTALLLIREGVNTTYPLMDGLGMHSSSVVRSFVRKLKARGWAEEDLPRNGTLRLTPKGRRRVRHLTLAGPGDVKMP